MHIIFLLKIDVKKVGTRRPFILFTIWNLHVLVINISLFMVGNYFV